MYNFINQKYEDIINNLDAYDKAVIVKGSEELSDQYEAGYVIDQDPKPGVAFGTNPKEINCCLAAFSVILTKGGTITELVESPAL